MLYVVCARSVWIKILDDEIFVNLTGFSLLYYSMVFQRSSTSVWKCTFGPPWTASVSHRF